MGWVRWRGETFAAGTDWKWKAYFVRVPVIIIPTTGAILRTFLWHFKYMSIGEAMRSFDILLDPAHRRASTNVACW